ncbi:MAG: universal stress protein [Deltaproteobacteria bacterium]|nr:universal stress protein [Deltaproteobacteria bacterium]
MKPVKKLLFPVDLSEVSPRIAPWVLDLANTFDAEVHLVFVARRFEQFSTVYVSPRSIEAFEQEISQGAERGLEEFVKAHFESKGFTRCVRRVVLGDAAEEILDYIRAENIDLVVMGTHGRKGLERVLFGSVADHVVKMSTVPVLTVNPYRVDLS